MDEKKKEEIKIVSVKNTLPVDQYYILPKFLGYKSVCIIDTKTQKQWNGLVVLEITLPNSPCTIYFDPNNHSEKKITTNQITLYPGIKYLTSKARVMGLFPLVPTQDFLPFLINFALGHIGIVSHYDKNFIYEIQNMVYPNQHQNKYNIKKIEEEETKIEKGCGHGIHFFIDPKSAIHFNSFHNILGLSQIFISDMITKHTPISKFTLDVYKSLQIGKSVSKEDMDLVNELPYYYEDDPENIKFSEYAEYERKFGRDCTTYTVSVHHNNTKQLDEMERIRNIQNEYLKYSDQKILCPTSVTSTDDQKLLAHLCQTISTSIPTSATSTDDQTISTNSFADDQRSSIPTSSSLPITNTENCNSDNTYCDNINLSDFYSRTKLLHNLI